MSFSDFMGKVRYFDNQIAKWMVRHFYLIFFEAFLMCVLIGLFALTLQVINISPDIHENNLEKLLLFLLINSLLLTFLLILCSLLAIYIFNELMRTRATLKEISFHLSKRRPD